MATTQQLIDSLKKDKQNLVSMLNNMGVEANDTETFTSLTPKVGTIVTDPILQDKSVEITENGTTNIVADEGYDGLGNVEVVANVVGESKKYAPRFLCFYCYTGEDLTQELASLDTSNMTSMVSMFDWCSNLINLDLSSFDTSNVEQMTYMFSNASKLIELDLSSFDTNKVTSMGYMFNNCKKLEKLDMRNFVFTNVTNNSNMFTNVPSNCEIIVKDETAKNWVLAQRSNFTNIKTVAEL